MQGVFAPVQRTIRVSFLKPGTRTSVRKIQAQVGHQARPQVEGQAMTAPIKSYSLRQDTCVTFNKASRLVEALAPPVKVVHLQTQTLMKGEILSVSQR